jgi:hypothetical protein
MKRCPCYMLTIACLHTYPTLAWTLEQHVMDFNVTNQRRSKFYFGSIEGLLGVKARNER